MSSEFKLPEVGEGIDTGTVVSVLVAVGDTVEVDQSVLELETDKAVVEVPSSVAGTVEKVHVAEGDEVAIGSVVLTVGEGDGAAAATDDADGDADGAADADDADAGADADDGGDDGAGERPAPSDGAKQDSAAPGAGDADRNAPKRASVPSDASGSDPDASSEDLPGGLIPAAPSVRRLARERGVDLRAVRGSGILGRISAEDVEAFADGRPTRAGAGAAAGGAPAAAAVELPDFSPFGETERVAMSGVRKATVRTMAAAWSTVPMVTHFDVADATEFEALRKRFQPWAEQEGAKLTPTAMLIKVVASALRKFPDFNASIDVAAQEIVYKRYVNVGVAVDTDHGLLVPVVRNADEKNMIDLAVELGELAAKARDRKLSPDEMRGGNFSVSNLGGIGGTGFTPIVNPPDVAILGVSRGGIEPVWDPEQETFVPRRTMPLSVTYDHRLIDGAMAARFLRWVCRAVEEPFLLALEG
ncbi:MAG: 2-oxo acid dehydrogenase subunit E2 [Trueperaceae bacterium]